MVVEKFFCFDLELTAIFFGWLGVISTVYPTILAIGKIVEAHEHIATLRERGYYNIHESAYYRDPCMFLVTILVFGAASICLILGTVKKRHNLVLVWLIVSALGIVFSIIFMFSTGTYVSLLGLPLSIYLWIAMFSLYKRIKSERQTGFSRPAEFMPKQMA
ncbi:uncharacterized protein LOC126766758 [Bactrocera neohumeralis]|uniref:uncharacterized protein LOC126766758 n=1 Tax=Bactrocera neohumeralis TaxID=98809 RepID=UPI0021667241|nr:uncharacterized protein LOC126766758 [Bactrocera neohumeralis]